MKLITRISLLVAIATIPLSSQAQNSAREALGIISTQYGPNASQWIAEISGSGGVPQPFEWDVVAFDDRAPRLLYRFRTAGGRASDLGVDRQFYPEYAPAGYFSANQIGVDSVAAFTIAEGEARKAKMAFDSCNYLLRVRDFSTEPFWRLDLVDVRRAIVGRIYLSANSGAVYRTIWIYRDQRARPDGEPLIIDSSAPTQRSLTTGITGGDIPARTPSPGESPGIVQTVPPAMAPSFPAPEQGDTGITGAPAPPATPQMTSPSISGIPPATSSPQVFRPVDPNGRVIDSAGSIPDPPAITSPSTTTAIPPATTQTTPRSGMADLRDEPAASTRSDPTKPPIEVPAGTGGSSERIPPPPIPR
ncbi:MAG: hypothetical protein P1U58_03290 [Verrucomicrobiales bacterium]|nr:hypothetical protein [Verrucomicrobiales bacterium]